MSISPTGASNSKFALDLSDLHQDAPKPRKPFLGPLFMQELQAPSAPSALSLLGDSQLGMRKPLSQVRPLGSLGRSPVRIRQGALSVTLTPVEDFPEAKLGSLTRRSHLAAMNALLSREPLLTSRKHERSPFQHPDKPQVPQPSSSLGHHYKRRKAAKLLDRRASSSSSSSNSKPWIPPVPDFSFSGVAAGRALGDKVCPPTPARPRHVTQPEAKKLEIKFKNANRALSMIALKIPRASVGRGDICFALRVRNLDQLLPYIRNAIADDDNLDILESHLQAKEADYIVHDTTPLSEVRVLKTFHEQSMKQYSAKFRETIIGTHMDSYTKAGALEIPCAVYYNNPSQDFFYVQEYLPVGLDNHPTFAEEISRCDEGMTNLSPAVRSILDQCKQIILKAFKGSFPIDASADGGNLRMKGDTVVCSDHLEIGTDESDEFAMKMIQTVRILSRGANPRNAINRAVYKYFRSEFALQRRLVRYDEML